MIDFDRIAALKKYPDLHWTRVLYSEEKLKGHKYCCRDPYHAEFVSFGMKHLLWMLPLITKHRIHPLTGKKRDGFLRWEVETYPPTGDGENILSAVYEEGRWVCAYYMNLQKFQIPESFSQSSQAQQPQEALKESRKQKG